MEIEKTIEQVYEELNKLMNSQLMDCALFASLSKEDQEFMKQNNLVVSNGHIDFKEKRKDYLFYIGGYYEPDYNEIARTIKSLINFHKFAYIYLLPDDYMQISLEDNIKIIYSNKSHKYMVVTLDHDNFIKIGLDSLTIKINGETIYPKEK